MQSRFFQSVPHAKALPLKMTSHQVLKVARKIHSHGKSVVTPLLDSKPQYVALDLMLNQLEGTINQLAEAQNHRRYKAVKEMRGVGGVDGESQEVTISNLKKGHYRDRAQQLRQFRRMVEWHSTSQTDFASEASLLGKLLRARVKGFESAAYDEADAEFFHFFTSIDTNPEAMTAIGTLGLNEVYTKMKTAHESIDELYEEQTMLESKRETKPKLRISVRDVRHTVRMLLGLMHFDVESGDPTLLNMLAQIDEMIDRAGAVGELRKTLSDKKADKAKAAEQDQDSQDQPDADGESPEASDDQDQANGAGNTSPETQAQSAQTD